MAALSFTDFMVRGQQYTFSFNQSGWNPVRLGSAEATGALQYISSISGVTVTLVGGVLGLFASQYDVNFTYTGDGADVVGNVAQDIMTALESAESLSTFDFLGANTGSVGVTPDTAPASKTSAPGLGALGSSSLWAIAAIVIVGAFVLSGGASATRRAIG